MECWHCERSFLSFLPGMESCWESDSPCLLPSWPLHILALVTGTMRMRFGQESTIKSLLCCYITSTTISRNPFCLLEGTADVLRIFNFLKTNNLSEHEIGWTSQSYQTSFLTFTSPSLLKKGSCGFVVYWWSWRTWDMSFAVFPFRRSIIKPSGRLFDVMLKPSVRWKQIVYIKVWHLPGSGHKQPFPGCARDLYEVVICLYIY